MALNDRHTALLAVVESFIEERGFSPTVRELAAHQSMSPAGIYLQLRALRDAGMVDWIDGTARTLRVTNRQ